VGTILSAYALGNDIAEGDVPMGVGDGLGTVGGSLELYAIAAPGAKILGVSSMTAGLVLGGIGIAVTSAVMGVRAYHEGDKQGVLAGGLGVIGGLAIAAGTIAGAPLLLGIGIGLAVGVGIFHLGRHFGWWKK